MHKVVAGDDRQGKVHDANERQILGRHGEPRGVDTALERVVASSEPRKEFEHRQYASRGRVQSEGKKEKAGKNRGSVDCISELTES